MALKELLPIFILIGALNGKEVLERKPGASPSSILGQKREVKSRPVPEPSCCTPCKGPSDNCPPQLPPCDPCDSMFDFYNPLVFNGWDFSLEWLYLTVQQKGTAYALTPHGNHQAFPPTSISDAIGKYQYASFDWNSGVRAHLNYTFLRDAWNLSGVYTYYTTGGLDQVYRPSDPTLYLEAVTTGISLPLPSDGVDEIHSSTSFRYQQCNLLLSRRFLAGNQVILNFYAGATGAFINQEWTVSSSYILASPPLNTKTEDHWSFNGGGIRIGIDADLHMGGGLGLYNKLSFANVVGAHSNHRITHFYPPNQTINSVPVFNPVRDTTEKLTWVVPNTEVAFGLSWNHQFKSASMRILAGLEIDTWYNLSLLHQDMIPPTLTGNSKLDIQKRSPITLWGLNLGTEFSF